MTCREARLALALALGPLDREGELGQHLERCPRCAGLAATDDRIDAARLALLAEPQVFADVRARVVAAIAHLPPVRHDEPRPSELGLAAATAGLAASALLLVAASEMLPWQEAAHGLRGLLGGAAEVASVLGVMGLAAMRVALRLLSATAARMEVPFAAAIGLGYAAMACTILCVLGRDLRRSARPRLQE